MSIITDHQPDSEQPHDDQALVSGKTATQSDLVLALPTAVLSHRVGAAGLCSDANDDRWFPTPEPRPTASVRARRDYEDRARAACLGCTVMPECRELALRIEAQPGIQSHGIWGGLAPWERRDLIRARGKLAAATVQCPDHAQDGEMAAAYRALRDCLPGGDDQ